MTNPIHTDLSEKDRAIIHDILIEQLEITLSQITPEARIESDLGADSLDTIEIGMMVEERFGVSVPDEALGKIEKVGDLYRAIASLMEKDCPTDRSHAQ